MIKIRSYTKKDYLQVKAVLQEADLFDEIWDSEENLSGMIDKDTESILVAMDNHRVVGNLFIIAYGSKVAYLFRLAVKKEYRNQGIASKLIKRAEGICKTRKVKEIGLYVNKDNQALKDFYQKRQFRTSTKQFSYNYFWKTLN